MEVEVVVVTSRETPVALVMITQEALVMEEEGLATLLGVASRQKPLLRMTNGSSTHPLAVNVCAILTISLPTYYYYYCMFISVS